MAWVRREEKEKRYTDKNKVIGWGKKLRHFESLHSCMFCRDSPRAQKNQKDIMLATKFTFHRISASMFKLQTNKHYPL